MLKKKASYEKLKKDPQWLAERRQKTCTYREIAGRKPELSNPETKRRYRQTVNGKSKVRANDAKRRAEKIKRTPAWLTNDDHWMIEQAYELASMRTKLFGFSWHVDHIIPLQGKLVSGLHMPDNLQVIPASVNISKSNKFVPV